MNETCDMRDWQVRPAVPSDLHALIELYGHLNPDEPPPHSARAEGAWDEVLRSNCATVFVIEGSEGKLISSCCLAIIPTLTHGAKPFGVIEAVVAHAEYRRRGCGSAVLKAAIGAPQAAGCYKLCLATGSTRETTLRFYENAGFKRGTKTFFERRWV